MLAGMTLGEKLLALTVEYSASVSVRQPEYEALGGYAPGREPAEIGSDYEAALRELLGGLDRSGDRAGEAGITGDVEVQTVS